MGNNKSVNILTTVSSREQYGHKYQHLSRQHQYQMLKNTYQICYIILIICLFGFVSFLPSPTNAMGDHIDLNGDIANALISKTVDNQSSAEIIQPSHSFRHQQHYSHRIQQADYDFQHVLMPEKHLRDHNENVNNVSSDSRNINDSNASNSDSFDDVKQQINSTQQRQHSRIQRHKEHLQQLRHKQAAAHRTIRHQRHQQPQLHVQRRSHKSDILTTKAIADINEAFAVETGNEHHYDVVGADNGTSIAENVYEATTVNNNSPNSDASPVFEKSKRYFDRDSLFSNLYTTTSRLIPSTHGPKAMSYNYKESYAHKLRGTISPLNSNIEYNDDTKNEYVDSISYTNSNSNWRDAIEDERLYEEEEQKENANKEHSARLSTVKRYTTSSHQIVPKIYNHSPSQSQPQYQDDDTANIGPTSKYTSSNHGGNEHNTDDENEFSSEKWELIKYEHYLKQLKHQRDLQAMREIPKFSSINKNNVITSTRGPINNNDDVENIFSNVYIPGVLTHQKQQELGTLEAVRESRRTHVIQHKQNKALASAHVKQVISEASCRIPQRRIERIERDPAKIYTPHCTVLHRCTDDTGCCRSERQTCAPKHTKSVELYFFVKNIGEKKGAIEQLTLVNHTECHCVDKASHMPDEYAGNIDSIFAQTPSALGRGTVLDCNCPKLYEKILQEDNYCRCDCSSGNMGCDWLKRGMEHFSMIDRKCILDGRCKPPTCAYGIYVRKHGRCPRREEQFSTTMLSLPMTNTLPARNYH